MKPNGGWGNRLRVTVTMRIRDEGEGEGGKVCDGHGQIAAGARKDRHGRTASGGVFVISPRTAQKFPG